MNSLQTIKMHIENWNRVRNDDAGLQYLTAGFGFEISRGDYVQLGNLSPNSTLNVYIGIGDEDETVFYILDADLDANSSATEETVLSHLLTKKFTKENIAPDQGSQDIMDLLVNETEGMKRAFKWFLFSNVWFRRKQTEYEEAPRGAKDQFGVVRVFSLPYIDLKNLFDDPERSFHSVFIFPGIKDLVDDGVDKSHQEIELLVAGVDYSESDSEWHELDIMLEDVAIPKPPFPIDYAKHGLLTPPA